jgi:hypothetical protein
MLDAILAARPATSVDGVIALMAAIDETLPDGDGLKWFNRLYLRVTVAVRDALAQHGPYEDPTFIEHLDIVFGNLYFEAAAAGHRQAQSCPPAWRPVFEARDWPRARLQHALAGMNAHINRDLPLGIVETFEALGGRPSRAPRRRRDYDRVDDLLERVEAEVRAEFAVGVLGVLDRLAGTRDQMAAMWSIRKARAAAWTNAEVLWSLRRTPTLRDRYVERLDSFTGFAGRGLLAEIPIRA